MVAGWWLALAGGPDFISYHTIVLQKVINLLRTEISENITPVILLSGISSPTATYFTLGSLFQQKILFVILWRND